MAYLKLEEIEAYRSAMEIGNEVWKLVEAWDYFKKDTIGKQLCRSADSIAANISEEHGRFHYAENQNFCFYARGSLTETKTWLDIAHERNFFDNHTHHDLIEKLKRCHLILNLYIKSIGKSSPK